MCSCQATSTKSIHFFTQTPNPQPPQHHKPPTYITTNSRRRIPRRTPKGWAPPEASALSASSSLMRATARSVSWIGAGRPARRASRSLALVAAAPGPLLVLLLVGAGPSAADAGADAPEPAATVAGGLRSCCCSCSATSPLVAAAGEDASPRRHCPAPAAAPTVV